MGSRLSRKGKNMNKKIIDKILIVSAVLILILCVIFAVESRADLRGGSNDMYAEIYNLDGDFITNIKIEKYSVTERVFDFDTSSFEGVSNDTLTEAQIDDSIFFIFKDDTGNYEYSGFVKNMETDDNYVKFKGDDFKKIYNTMIELDYSQTDYTSQPEDFIDLDTVFFNLTSQVELGIGVGPELWPTAPTSAQFNTSFINNPSGRKVTKNAWSYLKPYLVYYQYRVDIKYIPEGTLEHRITVELVDCNPTDNIEIKLDDFIFDKTTTEASTNQAIARITPPDNKTKTTSGEQLHMWTWSSEELYNATPVANQVTIDLPNTPSYATYDLINFEDSFDDYELAQAIRVRFWAGAQTGEPDRIMYTQSVDLYEPYETTAQVIYYLGKDNNIYYEGIPAAQSILPVQQKIYYAETLSEAQFNAVFDLTNSRYIEYIILTNINSGPVDITALELYDFIDVYDSNGDFKVLPVSEITYTQDTYKVKLGFKKILLTEIIKGGN